LLCCSSAVDAVLVCHAVLCCIMVSIAGEVDEFEISLPASTHACGVARQFLFDVFHKRSPFPRPIF
jgi:hypothetical protein